MNVGIQNIDDGSIPGSNYKEKLEIYEYWQSYNLDKYYKFVSSLTFKSSFIPLSSNEINILRKYLVNPNKLNKDENRIMNKLKENIENIINEYKNRVFIKLGSRSPKDSVDKLPKLLPILKLQLEKYPKTSNGEFIAMRYALMEAMSVSNVNEAFELFSYSTRIVEDLQRDATYQENESKQVIVIREFNSIPLQGELRAFVFNKKLTGLSQYYTNCYFPWIIENEEIIINRVKCFIHSLIESLDHINSYIIDLIVYEKENKGKHKQSNITLVELNPWTDKTGSALYNWKEDKDKLENGPFEFKFLKQEPNVRVGSSWQSLIDQVKNEKIEEKEKEKEQGKECYLM